MKVRISLEQTIDLEDAMSNDIGFELYGPPDMSTEDKVDYLMTRFAEDIDSMVKYDKVLGNISVEYIEDHNHYWECDDVPGYFYCACGVTAIHNRETGEKDIHD